VKVGASWHTYCYIIYIYSLKSLAFINGLTRLLALASCDCLHYKRRFCCKLSQRITTNRWRHGRQLKRCFWRKYGRMLKRHVIVVNKTTLFSGRMQTNRMSVGLVTGSNWSCYIAKKSVCRRTRPFDRSSRVLLSTTQQKSVRYKTKIYLVVRRGWQDSINRRSVTEVREREAHDDISSEESTSHHLLWDLNDYNTWAIHQHCVLAVCIPKRTNCRPYIGMCQPLL